MNKPNATEDLLLEIGCEELPTAAVKLLSGNLAEKLTEALKQAHLNFGAVKAYATPRRLAVYIADIATQQPTQKIERQGPGIAQAFDANGKPTAAALGFAQSCGIAMDAVMLKETPKGKRLFYEGEQAGQSTITLLPELIRQTINKMSIARPMRWGAHTDTFARPVHWIVLLFGNAIINTTLFGLTTGNQSYGHRFLHPAAFTVTEPKEYANLLKKAFVIADFEQRKQEIIRQITANTPAQQHTEQDEELLNEVTSLVEWPQALVGHFNPAFLSVPAEALITSMKVNQKYFPILANGQLQSAFILISNITSNHPNTVIHGNERVINARLSDAAFFYQNDLAHSLQNRLAHLEQVTFQKQLGSLATKTERMVQLADFIAEKISGTDVNAAKQAAQLSKCDLLSEMVGEFPTLQGIMGYYYAKNDGLKEACALAIKEHYYPRFSGDALPSNQEGCAVALADKLDTLVGIFGINQAPTGDKDPFALRRAANGILSILIDKELPLDLIELLEKSKSVYTQHLPNAEVVHQAFDFIMTRLKSLCQERWGMNTEQFAAVLAAHPTMPLDFKHRLEAVLEFQTLPEADALIAANKRVSNILKKQITDQTLPKIDPTLFAHEAERTLAKQLEELTQQVMPLYKQGEYKQALRQLAALKEPIDTFFEQVMVMVDDPHVRDNRLALLAALHHLFCSGVADISLLK